MSENTTQTTKSYLTAERNFTSLIEGMGVELEAHRANREQLGENELVTTTLWINGELDLALGSALRDWSNDGTQSRDQIKVNKAILDLDEDHELRAFEGNLDYIREHGLLKALGILALTSDVRIESPNYDVWKPYCSEFFLRIGIRQAARPMLRELITKKYQPRSNPSGSVTNETLLRLGLAADVLSSSSIVFQEIARKHGTPKGKREYLGALASGLLLEYDAYNYLLEERRDLVAGHGLWHLPAPLNMDLSPSGDKVDLMSIHLSFGSCNTRAEVYDVKSKEAKKKGTRKRSDSDKAVLLTPSVIGAERTVRNGRINVNSGARSSQYLKSHLQYQGDKRYPDIETQFAHGAAIAGANIPNLEKILVEHIK